MSCDTKLKGSIKNLKNTVSLFQAMRLVDRAYSQLIYNTSLTAGMVKLAVQEKKPTLLIIKTLKDMITDRPSWNELSDGLKEDIMAFEMPEE